MYPVIFSHQHLDISTWIYQMILSKFPKYIKILDVPNFGQKYLHFFHCWATWLPSTAASLCNDAIAIASKKHTLFSTSGVEVWKNIGKYYQFKALFYLLLLISGEK